MAFPSCQHRRYVVQSRGCSRPGRPIKLSGKLNNLPPFHQSLVEKKPVLYTGDSQYSAPSIVCLGVTIMAKKVHKFLVAAPNPGMFVFIV